MKENMSLKDYQELVTKLAKDRGFDDETVPEKFMLLTEEIGEFAKAVRKNSGIKVGDHSKLHSLEEESADIFFLLIDLCNKLGINLEQAFSDKEKVNEDRSWS